MSMISAQCDELRKTADELQSLIDNGHNYTWSGFFSTLHYAQQELRSAADIIWELREMAQKESAEHAERIVALEELVADMYEVIEESDFNPIVEIPSKRGGAYAEDPSWRVGIKQRMRELGIEVES